MKALHMANNDSVRASILIKLSNTYIEVNLLDSSLQAADQAKALALKANLPIVAGWADFLRGAYFFYEGYYDEGIRIEQGVVELAEQQKVPLLKANAQKLIGWMYTEMGKEAEALALFMEAMPVFKQHRYTDLQMNVGIGYYGMATAYFYLQEYAKALSYYDSAITADPPMDSREMALALADRAAVYIDYFDNDKAAMQDVLRANALLENQPLQRDAQAYVQAEWARILARGKNYKQAEKWAQSAYELYKEIPLVKRYVSVYKTLSEAFYLSGNFKQAYQVEYETRLLNDSIYKWRKLHVIEELQAKYETDKKNVLIAQMELERIDQTNVIIKNQTALMLLGLFFLLLLTVALLYYAKREKYHKRIKDLELAQKVREERDRIARELHDNLGGQLSSISIGLGRVQYHTDSGIIEGVQVMADRALHELRDSLWVLNKETIAVEEVEQRVNTLFWQYRKIEIPMQLEAQFDSALSGLHLPSTNAGHLYRIVQEAVSNSVKHSGATLFSLTLSLQYDLITLVLEDNGKGFNCAVHKEEEHFGLRNMKKRAEAMKATFSITNAQPQGTRIELVFSVSE